MELKGKNIGLAMTGSFCTFAKMEQEIRKLKETGAILYPIFSSNVQTTDSRFGDTGDFIRRITGTAGNPPILGLACGITDTPVLMAAKAHLRNGKPLVISVSTNDALGINFKNIGELFNTKNIYFVPFGQDDPEKKPCSMIARTELIEETLKEALEGRQIQPVIRGHQ